MFPAFCQGRKPPLTEPKAPAVRQPRSPISGRAVAATKDEQSAGTAPAARSGLQQFRDDSGQCGVRPRRPWVMRGHGNSAPTEQRPAPFKLVASSRVRSAADDSSADRCGPRTGIALPPIPDDASRTNPAGRSRRSRYSEGGFDEFARKMGGNGFAGRLEAAPPTVHLLGRPVPSSRRPQN